MVLGSWDQIWASDEEEKSQLVNVNKVCGARIAAFVTVVNNYNKTVDAHGEDRAW